MHVDLGGGSTKHKSRRRSRIDIRSLSDPSDWILPFGNLMTILMIFFLVLYAFSATGGIQYEKALASLEKNVTGKKFLKSTAKIDETEVASKLSNELSKFAKVEINAQRIKILLPSPVLFESGKVDLKPEAIETLTDIAQSIKSTDNKIIVEGHTDNVPVSGGKFTSNWELSAARAFSVIKYFIDTEKFSPSRFTAFGYGEIRPIAPNDTEENKSLNRRIEINIMRSGTQQKTEEKTEPAKEQSSTTDEHR